MGNSVEPSGRLLLQLLNIVLTVSVTTPWGQDDILLVERWHKVLPLGDDLSVGVELVLGVLVKRLLDGFQKLWNVSLDRVQRNRYLFTSVSSHCQGRVLGQVLWTNLQSDWNTLKLPVGELPTRRVVCSEIGDSTHLRGRQLLLQLGTSLVQLLFDLLGGLVGNTNRNDHDLVLRHSWRNHQSLVVGVDHHHDTNDSSRQTPRSLVSKNLWMLRTKRVFHRNAEHLGEVLTQVVRGSTLNTSSTGWNVTFTCGGVQSSSKLLVLGLDTLYHRNSNISPLVKICWYQPEKSRSLSTVTPMSLASSILASDLTSCFGSSLAAKSTTVGSKVARNSWIFSPVKTTLPVELDK
ncbi:hypothetical protein OGAPHI_006256 [Ogataea philodendri]|uniref:Secreted protein n=1 Tax=Ogataea philodendri TaxID=1378263 RepID=A0A9P8T1M0_9ASCO|nr:uncharacterized protein OGAPHI_006256 [Ogataea philodendri]KAH3662075.1 hypothetical protein OGAPHI_006256 [Ogataea philodendri]